MLTMTIKLTINRMLKADLKRCVLSLFLRCQWLKHFVDVEEGCSIEQVQRKRTSTL